MIKQLELPNTDIDKIKSRIKSPLSYSGNRTRFVYKFNGADIKLYDTSRLFYVELNLSKYNFYNVKMDISVSPGILFIVPFCVAALFSLFFNIFYGIDRGINTIILVMTISWFLKCMKVYIYYKKQIEGLLLDLFHDILYPDKHFH